MAGEEFRLETEQMWSLQNDAEKQDGPGELLEIRMVLIFFKWASFQILTSFPESYVRHFSPKCSRFSLRHPFSEGNTHGVICLLFYLLILLFFSSSFLLSDRLAWSSLCTKGNPELPFLLLHDPVLCL